MKTNQQAILARDIIDMVLEYPDDVNILKYIESFCSSLGLIFKEDSIVNWLDVAGVCDQRYYSILQKKPFPLNIELLEKWHKVAEDNMSTNNRE